MPYFIYIEFIYKKKRLKSLFYELLFMTMISVYSLYRKYAVKFTHLLQFLIVTTILSVFQ